MTTSVDEVCIAILKNPKPLVFIDTCTILDVIRVLHRDSIPDTYTEYALKIIDRCAQNDVWLITAENVPEEYANNIDTVVKEAQIAIKKTNSAIQSLQHFQSITSNQTMLLEDFAALNLQTVACNISDKLLSSCIPIRRENDYVLKAAIRVRGYIAPAQRGKAEYKDCEIVECFLDLASKLRTQKYINNIIFVTSNTKDYGCVGKLHTPLENQFQAVDAEYANSLDHALHLCGIN